MAEPEQLREARVQQLRSGSDWKLPSMTASEIFSKISMMSKESSDTLEGFLDSAKGSLLGIVDQLAKADSSAAIFPRKYVKPSIYADDDFGFMKYLCDQGLFVELTTGKVAPLIDFISGHLTSLTNREGSVYCFTVMEQDVTLFNEIHVDIMNQDMTKTVFGSLTNTHALHASLLVHIDDELGCRHYFLNNIVPCCSATTKTAFENFINTHFPASTSIARDDSSMIDFMIPAFRFVVPNVSNAKAAFNQKYELGIANPASLSSKDLFGLVFPDSEEGSAQLQAEYIAYRSEDHLNFTNFYDLLLDLRDSCDLNEINTFVSDAISSGEPVSVIQSYLSNITCNNAEVDGYVTTLKKACGNGLSSVTATFANLLAEAQAQDDGKGGLEFTKGDSQYPRIFLAGLIKMALTILGQAVSAILTAIVNYILPGIGLIVYGTLQGILGIGKAIGAGVDALTLAQLNPDNSIFAFTYAHDQTQLPRDELESLSSPIPSLIDRWGMLVQILPFAIILMWQDMDNDNLIDCEVHIRPLNSTYSYAFCEAWGDFPILLNTGYYYLPASLPDRWDYIKDSFAWLTEHTLDYSSYDIQDMEDRDKKLRRDYMFSLVLYRYYMLLMEQYPTTMMPYNSSGTLLWSNSDAANQVESIYRCVASNGWSNILHGDVVISWRQIIGKDSSTLSGLPCLFMNNLWGYIPYGKAYGVTSNFADSWYCVQDMIDTSTEGSLRTVIQCQISYIFRMPYYDRQTFVIGSIVASVAVAAIAVGIAISCVKFKKWQRENSANNLATAEHAWDDYKANPTDANYKKYKSAVFKNNLLSHFNGGSRLSKNSYWSSPDSSRDDSDGSPSLERSVNLVYKSVTGETID